MQEFKIEGDNLPTVLSALRQHVPGNPSWSAVRKLVYQRFVAIGGSLCLDESRRLRSGETVAIHKRPLPPPPGDSDVRVCYVDKCLVVVEKPAGMLTLRRKSEYAWPWKKRNVQPTLDECVPRLIAEYAAKKRKQARDYRRHPRLFPVHRLDRDSSGLLVFARDQESQTKIIRQFAAHLAVRKYLALIPGAIDDQTIRSQLIRDRGDGLRGSTKDESIGEHAVTHFRTIGKHQGISEIACRLETGRTNQIRIHLAEAGHPICGDRKYRGPFAGQSTVDNSGIHRMALHATELKIRHPETEELLEFQSPWPHDILRFIESFSGQK